MRVANCLLLLLVFITPSLYGQLKTYTTARTDTPLRIDCILDDAWNEVEWSGDFIQRYPYDGVKPSQKTRFKVLYDDDNLYFYIRAFDTAPDSIVKRLSKRDTYEGDKVEVFIDSYDDKRTSFCFTASVSGVKSDRMITSDGDNWDSSWDPIWYLRTIVDDKGWIAEIRIPLSQLRFSGSDYQSWGLQVRRSIFRKDENSFWMPFAKSESGWVRHYGRLEGIENLKPKRQNEIAPYAVVGLETYKKDPDNYYKDGRDFTFNAGVDGRVGLTNNLTLDYTINPDFGQVEADASEVNLTAFESYFPEKRPFFVAGREITDYRISAGDGNDGDNIFYTRRIGANPSYYPESGDTASIDQPENTRILGALKLSGKTKNGWTIGIVEALTQSEYAKLHCNGEEWKKRVEPMTNYFVGRVSKDMNEGSTVVGGMFTATNRNIDDPYLNFLHTSAYTGGLDLKHRWKDNKYYIDVKTSFSHVRGDEEAIIRTQRSSRRYFQRPDASHVTLDSTRTSLTGHGGVITIGKSANSGLRYAGFLSWRSPSLELNDIGYLRSGDDVSQIFWIGYRIKDPVFIFRNLNVNLNEWHSRDFGFNYTGFGGNVNFWSQFKNYWSLYGGINYNAESHSTTYLRGGNTFYLPSSYNSWWGLSTDSRKKWRLRLSYSFQNGSYSSSWRQSFGVGLTYRPIDALSLSLSPNITESMSELQYVTSLDYNNETRYVLGKINQKTLRVELRLDLSITPNLSVQYFAQPFVAIGEYSNLKYVTNPSSDNYNDRFSVYDKEQISFSDTDDRWNVDENRDGTKDYSVSNPNYDYKVLLSNFVVRWEYRPGSTLFVVWSQNRTPDNDFKPTYNYDVDRIFRISPHDIFMVKFSYRFSL